MSEEDRAELALLRERAYGPRPSNELDTEELARLRYLEGAVAPEAAPHDASPVDSSNNASRTQAADAREPGRVRDNRAEVSSRPRLRISRTVAFVWAGSLIATALLTALVGSLQPGGDASTVAMLDADRTLAWSPSYGDAQPLGSTRYEDFYGLLVLAMPNPAGASQPELGQCLLVGPVETSGQLGCTAAGLDPVVDYVVGRTSPFELRDRFTDGTVLRFMAAPTAGSVQVATGLPPST